MKLIRLTILIAALLLPAIISPVEASPLVPKVGDIYEITRTKDSAQKGTGSNSSSHDKDTIIERVVGLRPDGLELEYDLPETTKAAERASQWQFPARIFKPTNGPAELLNRPELEARVAAWLKSAGVSRALCGHWYFTWNAFQVECDPQSVIKTVKSFELGPGNLHEGDSYQDPDASRPGKLSKKDSKPDKVIFSTEMPVDPDAVRRARAESDVVVGEIMREPVTLEAALSKHAKETVSGTISIDVETGSTGNVRRRTKVSKVNIQGPGTQSETDATTETLERRLISPRQ
ncbi:MAG TPA: hypothetical protein VL625_03805 [Patescibacteria group bacterium]|jgi:hypothetical protein|nr:hypothetical protein [Patescibacteria group bacterium]